MFVSVDMKVSSFVLVMNIPYILKLQSFFLSNLSVEVASPTPAPDVPGGLKRTLSQVPKTIVIDTTPDEKKGIEGLISVSGKQRKILKLQLIQRSLPRGVSKVNNNATPSVTGEVYCFTRRQLIFSFDRRVIYHSKGL